MRWMLVFMLAIGFMGCESAKPTDIDKLEEDIAELGARIDSLSSDVEKSEITLAAIGVNAVIMGSLSEDEIIQSMLLPGTGHVFELNLDQPVNIATIVLETSIEAQLSILKVEDDTYTRVGYAYRPPGYSEEGVLLDAGKYIVVVFSFGEEETDYTLSLDIESFEPVEVQDGTYVMSGLPLSGDEQTPSAITVRLTDDSPADGEGGAAFFPSGSNIIVVTDSSELTGSEIGFQPLVEGGFIRQGFIAADGTEHIVLSYDLTDPSYSGPDQSLVIRIAFELQVANDYRIEVKSDSHPEWIEVARAVGNIGNTSNMTVFRFVFWSATPI